jgi:hypothetical protein
MPTMFAVDENDDLYLDDAGNIAIVTGLEAVLQNCAHAVKAQLGEMILQTDQGMPDFQVIWNGNPNVSQFEASLREIILAQPNVISISELTTVINNNILSYTITIVTDFGEGAING